MPSSSKTTAASDAGEHWTAPYRRRLGINNSPVVPYNGLPPNPGQLKIVFFFHHSDTRSLHPVIAMALDSSMDLVGFTYCMLEFKTDVGMQLCALRAAANLANSLKDGGIHDEVVYHSHLELVSTYLSDQCCEGEHEAALRGFMPDNLEMVDKKCKINVRGSGHNDNSVVSAYSDDLPQLEGLIEKMKRDAEIASVGEHWGGEYRSCLGIGDSSVVVYKKDSLKNVFKILFLAVADGAAQDSTWTVGAIAVTSYLKLVGVAGGSMRFGTAMGMQLYALRAAGNLAEKLREKEVHIGHVVYQSGLVEGDDRQGELEAVVPDDFDNVDMDFLNVVGENTNKLLSQVEKLGSPALKALIEKMKIDAGTY